MNKMVPYWLEQVQQRIYRIHLTDPAGGEGASEDRTPGEGIEGSDPGGGRISRSASNSKLIFKMALRNESGGRGTCLMEKTAYKKNLASVPFKTVRLGKFFIRKMLSRIQGNAIKLYFIILLKNLNYCKSIRGTQLMHSK
jgi:hypothetical protein